MSDNAPDTVLSLSPNSRESAGYLAVNYGFHNLEQLKTCYAAVPKLVPRKRRIKTRSESCSGIYEALSNYRIHVVIRQDILAELGSQLYDGYTADSMRSDMMDISTAAATAFVEDFERLAPTFLEGASSAASAEVLSPPVTHCLDGCQWLTGKKKGMPRTLSWHRKPTEVTIFSGAGIVKRGLVVILRYQGCASRYSYCTWTKHDSSTYLFYTNTRDYLDVSQEVYVSRQFALEIVNQMLFNHATYDFIAETMKHTYQWTSVFSRKTVASIFLRQEIECYIRERQIEPYHFEEKRSILQYIDNQGSETFTDIYRHEFSEICTANHCGKMFILDGLWKTVLRHCTAAIKHVVDAIPLLNFPNVCINGPTGNSLFCSAHRYHEGTEPVGTERRIVHLTGISKAFRFRTGTDINAILSGETDAESFEFTCRKFDPNAVCAKNKGQGERGPLYSRGYLFLVGHTGHIFSFAPIYRAESLGQVFLFVINSLYLLLQNVPSERWEQIFICYDNICQLNRLRAANHPLPLEAPYDMMWSKITKIVDGLHIQNHKDPNCAKVYHPDKFYSVYPEARTRNTMAAEQTFSWMSKFRKQLNAMNKN